ncbi:hypothetical protein T05_15189 [Trichinella murrelli]|uniref:Uncharacterized protein n=1 Tax=Trichinella murrelli TaxID=144512 RepID=A0A0V0TCQ8_9BILA|nr:hypothetical protein T05_15189 [Trichinella murrelli]
MASCKVLAKISKTSANSPVAGDSTPLANVENGTSRCSPYMFLLRAATLGVVLQSQTIICDFEFALIPLMQMTFRGIHMQRCYFYFCQAVLR